MKSLRYNYLLDLLKKHLIKASLLKIGLKVKIGMTKDWDGNRIYIPYSESTITTEYISEDLKSDYKRILKIVEDMIPNISNINLVTGDAEFQQEYGGKSYSKKEILQMEKFFLTFIKKLIYSNENFNLLPEENFNVSKKDFVDKIINNEEFFRKDYYINLNKNINENYENKTDNYQFSNENLFLLLSELTKDYQFEILNFLYDTRRNVSDDEEGGEESDLMVVISKNHQDILNMSTDRKWHSCTNLYEGENKHIPHCEVEGGGFIAYLTDVSDDEVENPKSRVLIRRFDNTYGDSVALIENEIYGIKDQKFFNIVQNWVDEKQGKIRADIYSLKGGQYSDTYSDKPVFQGDIEEFFQEALDTDIEYGYVVDDNLKGEYNILTRECWSYFENKIKVLEDTPFFKTEEEAEEFVNKIKSTIPDKYELQNLLHNIVLCRLQEDYPEAREEYERNYFEGYDERFIEIRAYEDHFEVNTIEDLRDEISGQENTKEYLQEQINEKEGEIEEKREEISQTEDEEDKESLEDELEELEDELESLNSAYEDCDTNIADYERQIEEKEEELEPSDEERKLVAKITSPTRFDIMEISRVDYIKGIKRYNSTFVRSAIDNINNLVYRKTKLSRNFWDDFSINLTDNHRMLLTLNNETMFKDEYINELKSILDGVNSGIQWLDEKLIADPIIINKGFKELNLKEDEPDIKKSLKNIANNLAGLHQYFYSKRISSSPSIRQATDTKKNYVHDLERGFFVVKGLSSEDQDVVSLSKEIKNKLDDHAEKHFLELKRNGELILDLLEIEILNKSNDLFILTYGMLTSFIDQSNLFADNYRKLARNGSFVEDYSDKYFSLNNLTKEMYDKFQKLSKENLLKINEMFKEKGFYSNSSPDVLMEDKVKKDESYRRSNSSDVYDLLKGFRKEVDNMSFEEFIIEKRLYKNIDYFLKTRDFCDIYGRLSEKFKDEIKKEGEEGKIIEEELSFLMDAWRESQLVTSYFIDEDYLKFTRNVLDNYDDDSVLNYINMIKKMSCSFYRMKLTTKENSHAEKKVFKIDVNQNIEDGVTLSIFKILSLCEKYPQLKDRYSDILLKIADEIKLETELIYNFLIEKNIKLKELNKNKQDYSMEYFNEQYKKLNRLIKNHSGYFEDNYKIENKIRNTLNIKTSKKSYLNYIMKLSLLYK